MNGSPEYFDGHAQIGLWLTTSQTALKPHIPIHGFTHF